MVSSKSNFWGSSRADGRGVLTGAAVGGMFGTLPGALWGGIVASTCYVFDNWR
ncbi:hypothetical protein FACS189429_8510 [Bacteroidia bacterium]|nr:hypothetical protein FACS189429_8510 [Bacteroidia bacterium]